MPVRLLTPYASTEGDDFMTLKVEYLIDPNDPATICWTYHSFLPGLENARELGREGFADVHRLFGAQSFRIVDDRGLSLRDEFGADIFLECNTPTLPAPH